MLSLTCMAMFCIILDTYAQKHSSEELLEDSQPHMIANSKRESVRSDPLVVSAQPSLLQFSIPMLAAFNPFQLKHQVVGAKDVSTQLTDWFQPLRTNLFRPFPLSNTGALLGPVQTYPMIANLTHLGDLSKLVGSSGLLIKLADYEKKRQEIMKNAGFEINAPNGLILPEKANKDEAKGDDSSKNIFVTTNTNSEPLDGNNVTGTTDTTTNYYGTDSEMGKNSAVDGSDRIATDINRNLKEEKKLRNDLFWKYFFQINETDNTTQSSLGDLKEVVTTLNLSEAQTAAFVKIIGKIVDEELKRRHDEESKFTETSEKPKLVAAKFYELDNDSEKTINDQHEEEIRPHEKLTANTRLSFDEQRIIDDYRNWHDEISEALVAESLKLDPQKEGKWKTDYMAHEQAEYDRLVSGITGATSQPDHLKIKSIQSSSQELLRTTISSSTSTEEPQTSSSILHEKVGLQPVEQPYIFNRTTIIYGKVTSIPKTVFERQAEDFRSRLLGNNGFGDIINALKHAKIGFFERN